MAKQTKPSQLDRIQRTIAGIKKYFPNAPTLTLKGKATATQVLLSLLQSYIDAINASLSATSKMHDAVAAEKIIAAQVRPLLLAIKDMVLTLLGDSTEVLSDFGIPAAKPRKVTVTVKAAAVDKLRATRKANNTQGKRQRKQAKVTPPAQPAAGAAKA